MDRAQWEEYFRYPRERFFSKMWRVLRGRPRPETAMALRKLLADRMITAQSEAAPKILDAIFSADEARGNLRGLADIFD